MPDDMDVVFRALADGSRRKLLDALRAENGQTLSALCQQLEMTRQGVSKHLLVLEEANLVVTVWRGREKLHYLNPVPIGEIYERWIGAYDRERVRALQQLKRVLEEKEGDDGEAELRVRDVHREHARKGVQRADRP